MTCNVHEHDAVWSKKISTNRISINRNNTCQIESQKDYIAYDVCLNSISNGLSFWVPLYMSADLGADPVIVNPWGFNALYMATDTPELLERLLAYPSVDVNRRCGERQETAIHLAAVIGSVEATRTLLSAGADINALTSFNENALWLAIWKNHTEVTLSSFSKLFQNCFPKLFCSISFRCADSFRVIGPLLFHTSRRP